ncbi:hypothetical protein EX895_005179 [Sporisorium graminicola]|uniref:Uncharacterized protein n=1 Tax=Sporisorium graminicola TaxID=280036 RepID=A0A4U7KMW6_9BASI|nr:hypothetical protein EX895_005179 [Sporisorium graminicola]TKY85640.1 hypothetical protein EX895_005179 [Sporisorium graminicola]
MVRFKTRWLLLAIDDKPLATSSPFPLPFLPEDDDDNDSSAHPNSSTSVLSAAQRTSPSTGAVVTLTPQHITRLLRASLVYNFGDVAAGAYGGVLTCKYYSMHTGTAIVRCSRDAARLVWASATMISSPIEVSADDGSVSASARAPSLRIRVIHCGGTIKKVQNKAIELDRKLIMRLRAKQKRLAAVGSKVHPPIGDVKSATPALEDSATIVPVVPIAPVDDDEDLGEALDPQFSATEAPVASIAAPATTQPNQLTTFKSNESNVDPETQALLIQSRRQISSISM